MNNLSENTFALAAVGAVILLRFFKVINTITAAVVGVLVLYIGTQYQANNTPASS